jgi:hypothetical protein
MEINLYRIRSGWAIKAGKETEAFPSIESACEALSYLGIDDDSIDVALIEIYAKLHSRANFGINGRFVFTDGAQLDELFGVA